jgi:hypothetical protein
VVSGGFCLELAVEVLMVWFVWRAQPRARAERV